MSTKFVNFSLFTLLIAVFSVAASAATYTVTKTADTNDGTCDADCSLREAIAAANASADNDLIVFDKDVFYAPQTITLSGTEILIANNGSLTIHGPGYSKLTIDGNQQSRIFTGSTGAVINLDAVTLTRGNGVSVNGVNTNSAGAIHTNGGVWTITNSVFRNNATSINAGAIRNSVSGSSLTIDNCVFENNTAGSSSGGAIQNFSTSALNISNSLFVGNAAQGGSAGGGAIQANGQVRIWNSTFSGNSSSSAGGGISTNGTYFLLVNSTLTDNSAVTQGGGLHRGTTNVNAFVRNNIIAGNAGVGTSPDVTNNTGGLTSEGNNVIGVVGTSTGWVKSDQTGVDPVLGPLAYNGGLGMTHALMSGSPAAGAGNPCVLTASCATNNLAVPVLTDQRAETRQPLITLGISGIDAGAYEEGFIGGFLPNAGVDQPYDFVISPDAGGFTFTTSGVLPPGISLVENGGVVSLTGTASVSGTYQFEIIQEDGANLGVSTSHTYLLNVSNDPDRVYFAGRLNALGGNPPLSSSRLKITSNAGRSLNTLTSPLGYFWLEPVIPGSFYTLSVRERSGIEQSVWFVPLGSIYIETFTTPPSAFALAPGRNETERK